MGITDMATYLTGTISADYSAEVMTLTPHNALTEVSSKNQVIHTGDDGSEERISLSNTNIFKVELLWDTITEADAGTIADFFFNPSKGNGIARTFLWDHPTDGNRYVVRFDGSMQREIRPASLYNINRIVLRIIDVCDSSGA